MPDEYTIDSIAALSDDELAKALGLTAQLEEVKKGLAELKTLTGEARKIAEEKVTRMFTPHVYPGEFHYIKKDAERQAKKTGKEELCCCDPCSVMD